jgi:hyperosmotically inducible protein
MRKLAVLTVLVLILAGVGYNYYKRGWHLPPLFSSSEDSTTEASVKSLLSRSRQVSSYTIDVGVSGGIVTLKGQVPNEDIKLMAGEITREAQGVKEVKNEIEVNPAAQPSSDSARIEDLEIKTALLGAFARSAELGGKKIDVIVENHSVTLNGAVDTPAQRNGAEQVARAIEGVTGVTNNLTVANPQAGTEPPTTNSPPVDPNAELAKKVKFDLFETGAFDPLAINVTAADGVVTLSGTVRTRAEQLLAERIAQGTPGVKKVTNQLKAQAAPARR